jgi:hypothetical protein
VLINVALSLEPLLWLESLLCLPSLLLLRSLLSLVFLTFLAVPVDVSVPAVVGFLAVVAYLEFLLLHPYGCWRPQLFQLSLVLLPGLLLMCSYQCCFIPGAPSVVRVSTVSALPSVYCCEVSPVTGVSNVPGGPCCC